MLVQLGFLRWPALYLQDTINSATSITQTLSGELANGQRKLLAIAAAGANSNAGNPLVTQLSNGPLAHLHEMVCVLSLSPPPPVPGNRKRRKPLMQILIYFVINRVNLIVTVFATCEAFTFICLSLIVLFLFSSLRLKWIQQKNLQE